MCLRKNEVNCYLLLEDGTLLEGESFGADVEALGEVGRFLTEQTFVFSFRIALISICLLQFSRPVWLGIQSH